MFPFKENFQGFKINAHPGLSNDICIELNIQSQNLNYFSTNANMNNFNILCKKKIFQSQVLHSVKAIVENLWIRFCRNFNENKKYQQVFRKFYFTSMVFNVDYQDYNSPV